MSFYLFYKEICRREICFNSESAEQSSYLNINTFET